MVSGDHKVHEDKHQSLGPRDHKSNSFDCRWLGNFSSPLCAPKKVFQLVVFLHRMTQQPNLSQVDTIQIENVKVSDAGKLMTDGGDDEALAGAWQKTSLWSIKAFKSICRDRILNKNCETSAQWVTNASHLTVCASATWVTQSYREPQAVPAHPAIANATI